MGNGFSKVTLPDFSNVAPADATYVFNGFKSRAQEKVLFSSPDKNAQNSAIKRIEEAALQKKREKIQEIIANDTDAPKNINKEKIADMIIEAANETGIDPVVLASIAKKESHFNQNVPVNNGSGIMQLTTISVKDMYLRPGVYDPTMKKLIKKYGTFENVVAAKKKDPSIELGSFGNMLVKYGSADKLIAAMRRDPQLNFKLGGYLFKAKLANANGNLQKALEDYKTGAGKIAYAKTVIRFINETKPSSSFDGITA